jgi:hypothetical protein
MPRKTRPPINSISSNDFTARTQPTFDSDSGTLSPDQIRRWSELIADGRCEFPTALLPADSERLTAELRTLLRNRLVGLVARAIATQLHREAGNKREDTSNVRTQV